MRHAAELRRLAREATTPEDIRAVVLFLRDKALGEGDVAAAREFLDRTLGKAERVSEQAGPLAVDLAGASDPEGAAQAARSVLAAVERGDVSTDQAVRLLGVVEAAQRVSGSDEGGGPVKLNVSIRTIDPATPAEVVEVEASEEGE
jgi:hypothetical protein